MTESCVIVITGMHRSGTSLTASLIQKAGVNIGDRLIGPDKGNPSGHFEDVDFNNFHERALRRFGQSFLVQNLSTLEQLTPTQVEEAQFLIEQRSNRKIWGWKDPRTTLFLDFWYKLLPQARFLFVYRHPLEVVISLLRRNKAFDQEALANPLNGLSAWQVYNQAILDFYQHHSQICVLANISAIIADIQRFISFTAEKLMLPLQDDETETLYRRDVLSRINFTGEVSSLLERIAPEALSLYAQLENRADLSGPKIVAAPAQPEPHLVKLRQTISNLAPPELLEKEQQERLFSLLLTILAPEAMLSGKEALDQLRLKQISQLQSQLADLQKQFDRQEANLNQVTEELATIKATKAWQAITKWYTFKQRLKQLSQPNPIASPVNSSRRLSTLQPDRPAVLFISHYAGRTGAPILLLNFLKWLKANSQIPFEILLKRDGELRAEFEALAPTMLWNQALSAEADLAQIKAHLKQANIGLIFANTITNGNIIAALSDLHCPIICYVHELEYWITYQTNPKDIELIKRYTTHYIAGSQAVKENLEENLGISGNHIDVIHSFIPTEINLNYKPQSTRQQLNIPSEAFVVGACGTMDWRKSPDLFIQLARAVYQRKPGRPVHFIWVGGEGRGPTFGSLWHDVKRIKLEDRIHFVSTNPDFRDFLSACDVFTLVSREDPFPLVVLEAALLSKPVICFDKAGGAKEFVEEDAGFVVPFLDVETMADKVIELLRSAELCHQLGQQAAQKIRLRHNVTVAGPKMLRLVEQFLKKQEA